jgi:ABC-type multidrug transport system ATPase subunit
LQLYSRIKGLGTSEIRNVVAASASEVGLFPQLDVLASELSGGQRRKLSVAVAMLGNPSVVFLDVRPGRRIAPLKFDLLKISVSYF